jgi:Cu2+-exporting ATPase
MVGVGKAARHGILIKDAESLEIARDVKAVVLDKTGTLTEGRPEVAALRWLNDDASAKNILYAMEKCSGHPIGEAVALHLEADAKPCRLEHFEVMPGKGVKAVAEGKTYHAGNLNLLRSLPLYLSPQLEGVIRLWENDARTIVVFADSSDVLAVICIADRIKPTSSEAVSKLKAAGLDVYMLTGDNESTAKAVADKTGIKHYRASMLPADKAEFVRSLQAKGRKVAMVGDGINDSAALATADLSVAMGGGSDIAMDTAKMTIISSDLLKLPEAIRISRQTVRTIRENLFWAFIYNLISVPVAAGILYPVTGFLLNPMIAGAAMALSSLSVVSNSLRLKTKK